MTNFYKKLASWYLEHKRILPWRATKDPYAIWLSEIMLQQTRVSQGLPYYLRFIAVFPTVFDLADASEAQVLKLWQGLGYYSRARNLHATAKYVAHTCQGVFPASYKELLKLKGVGDYTASAIASICYQEPVPVVDGNVYRVLSRYFGIATPINSTAGIKTFKDLARTVMDTQNPGDYNQALMEFGSIQCKPKNPNCTDCPLSRGCVALEKNLTATLPVKIKKHKIKKRYFNYLVFLINDKHTVIRQRIGKGIWQNMYDFPLIETDSDISQEALLQLDQFAVMTSNGFQKIRLFNQVPRIHKLTHQHLYTRFYLLETHEIPMLAANHLTIDLDQIQKYPMPVLLDHFIQAHAF